MAIARVNDLFNIDLNGLFNENEHSLVCSPLLILYVVGSLYRSIALTQILSFVTQFL